MNHPEPFVQSKKAPSWCMKPKPCDYDPPTAYCPHRECRESLVLKLDRYRDSLLRYGNHLPECRPTLIAPCSCGFDGVRLLLREVPKP